MVNELVHRNGEELRHVLGVETTDGFKVFNRPRKVKVVVKAGKAGKVKAVGRPRVYNGSQRRIIGAALKHNGLTKGIKFLARERNLKVSVTLALSVAKEQNITFQRGRPAA